MILGSGRPPSLDGVEGIAHPHMPKCLLRVRRRADPLAANSADFLPVSELHPHIFPPDGGGLRPNANSEFPRALKDLPRHVQQRNGSSVGNSSGLGPSLASRSVHRHQLPGSPFSDPMILGLLAGLCRLEMTSRPQSSPDGPFVQYSSRPGVSNLGESSAFHSTRFAPLCLQSRHPSA